MLKKSILVWQLVWSLCLVFLFFDENAVNALNPAAWQRSFVLALSKANKLITVSAFLLANTGSMEKCYRALAISCADSPVLCTQVKMQSGYISTVHLPVLMRCSDGILLLLVQKLVDPGSFVVLNFGTLVCFWICDQQAKMVGKTVIRLVDD